MGHEPAHGTQGAAASHALLFLVGARNPLGADGRQLDDDPRAPIQQSFGDEFRQHDGVVTMMMFYQRRASPKLCDNMTEVEYGGGGHRTRLRNDLEDQLVCHGVPPCPRI